jgi:plastocyanin
MRIIRWRALLAGVLVAVAAMGAAGAAGSDDGGSAASTAAQADETIVGRDFTWTPDDVSIQVGDTVTWTNQQGFHNVVVDGERLNDPGFPDDDQWRDPPQKTFTTAGTYRYLCEVHGQMTGTVTVGGNGEPPPPPPPPPEPVPPPGDGAGEDLEPPALSDVSLTGGGGRLTIGWTVSEPATLNVRLTGSDGAVRTFRATSDAGSWTVERRLAPGRYSAEVWAVDRWNNRSDTQSLEVRI